MVGSCLNCGGVLPRNGRTDRKFCTVKCRVQYNRIKKNPGRNHRMKEPPSAGTGDKDIDKILNLGYEATLRKTLLDDLLEQRKEAGRQEGLAEAEKWKEERVLDPDTRRKVSRFLAEAFDPSRTR
jgi:hypothetical protein